MLVTQQNLKVWQREIYYNNSMSYNPMVIYGGLELKPFHEQRSERMLEAVKADSLVLKSRLELEQLKKENRDLFNLLVQSW